jgi:hypothetical protein
VLRLWGVYIAELVRLANGLLGYKTTIRQKSHYRPFRPKSHLFTSKNGLFYNSFQMTRLFFATLSWQSCKKIMEMNLGSDP